MEPLLLIPAVPCWPLDVAGVKEWRRGGALRVGGVVGMQKRRRGDGHRLGGLLLRDGGGEGFELLSRDRVRLEEGGEFLGAGPDLGCEVLNDERLGRMSLLGGLPICFKLCSEFRYLVTLRRVILLQLEHFCFERINLQ